MSYGHYFDRSGQPIDLRKCAQLLEDANYRVVAYKKLPGGRVLSTVWLGINHRWTEGPPLIFETMLFGRSRNVIEQIRTSTEAEALATHAQLLEELRLLDAKNRGGG